MEVAKEDFNEKELQNKYEIMKESIPKEWIKRIEDMEEEKQGKDVHVRLGEKLFAFNECTVKMFYCFFREGVFKKPKANEYWLQKYENLNEEDIWNNMTGKMIDAKLESFEYLIRHRAIFTGIILKRIHMELTETCKVCNMGDESFLHLFLNCRQLDDFKEKGERLIEMLSGGLKEKIVEWNRVVMFGMEGKGKNKRFINLCVMLMKSAIWERRIIAKKEKIVLDV